MDSIPNEMLLEIIHFLGKEDIPKLRLVSNRFNLLVTTCVQKMYQVKFTTDSDIAKFVTMFQHKVMIPFENFGFSKDLSAYGQPLRQFCVLFGKLVKYWSIFEYELLWLAGGNSDVSLAENVQVLLENCVNVEEIDLINKSTIFASSLIENYAKTGKCTKIPVLQNLKTITIKRFNVENKYFPLHLLLLQIFHKTPNLRRISIENLSNNESSCPGILADILNLLHNMNGTVRIQELCIYLEFPVSNIGDLEKLAAISTQFRVVDLQLYIVATVLDHHPERLLQQVEILPRLIQQQTPSRKLSLSYFDSENRNYRYWFHGPITMPLYSLAKLQCLNLSNLSVDIPIVPPQQTQFPVLTSLICRYDESIYNFSFTGCVFPNVKHAEISLKTEEECEQWPRVLPNVEKLYVWSKTLKGIFRFPKLWKLDVVIVHGLSDSDVREQWNHLTAGATYGSDGSTCSFPTNTPQTSDSIDSFRNLPLLTDLTLRGEHSDDCWRGIIYASRTGLLGRLQKLALLWDINKDINLREVCRTELMKYHDRVSTLSTKSS